MTSPFQDGVKGVCHSTYHVFNSTMIGGVYRHWSVYILNILF